MEKRSDLLLQEMLPREILNVLQEKTRKAVHRKPKESVYRKTKLTKNAVQQAALMRQGRSTMPDTLPGVSSRYHGQVIIRSYVNLPLLYADICGFTAFGQTHTAHEVVALVTTLFSTIDLLSRKLQVYKVLLHLIFFLYRSFSPPTDHIGSLHRVWTIA